jgi:DeoR/GlpR family transcriptional regulator of sugar metabolism
MARRSCLAAVARELGKHANLMLVTDSLIVANALIRQGIHKVILLGVDHDADEFAVRAYLSKPCRPTVVR